MQSQLDANFGSQEVLATLSADTGGKAFFDSNDFAPAFQQIQHDTEAYYILGFRSTDPARDGAYRRLTVKVKLVVPALPSFAVTSLITRLGRSSFRIVPVAALGTPTV